MNRFLRGWNYLHHDHLSDCAKPVIPVGVRAKWNRAEVQLWGVPAMQCDDDDDDDGDDDDNYQQQIP